MLADNIAAQATIVLSAPLTYYDATRAGLGNRARPAVKAIPKIIIFGRLRQAKAMLQELASISAIAMPPMAVCFITAPCHDDDLDAAHDCCHEYSRYKQKYPLMPPYMPRSLSPPSPVAEAHARRRRDEDWRRLARRHLRATAGISRPRLQQRRRAPLFISLSPPITTLFVYISR